MNYKLSIVMPVYNQEELVIKALDSIPKRKDIELIIVDDCSTDCSGKNINNGKSLNNSNFGNIVINRNEENRGVGYTKNRAYSLATGEYIHTIDSDDYVYTDNYNKAVDELYKNHIEDILILDHKDNSNHICSSMSCNATGRYFIKLNYLKKYKLQINPVYRRAEDGFLMREIEKTHPKFKRLKIVAYHYNFPRKGSISGNYSHNGDE